MIFDGMQRKQIKARAKAIVCDNLGRIIGINVLAALPLLLIGILWAAWAVGASTSVDWIAPYALGMASNIYGSLFGVLALLLLISSPLQYGMEQFYIALWRGEDAHVSLLFQAFTSLRAYWVSVKMFFCLAFRAWLWYLIPGVIITGIGIGTIIATVGRMAIYGVNGMNDLIMLGGTVGLLVLAVLFIGFVSSIFIQVKVLTYRAGYYLIRENEQRGAWDSTGESARAFKGGYWKAFAFAYSFLGWQLLYTALCVLCQFLMQMDNNGLVTVLCFVAELIIALVLGTFITAYSTVSFYGMYEAVRPQALPLDIYGRPIAPSSYAPDQSYQQVPPAMPEAPQSEQPPVEAPVTPEQSDEPTPDDRA